MKTYSDLFDFIDVQAVEQLSDFDSEAPTNMVFAYEESEPMQKKAFQPYKDVPQNFFGCYSVKDKDIWKISGKDIIRVENEISEG